MSRWSLLAVFAALVFAACGDDGTTPGDTGTSGDAQGASSRDGDGGLGADADAGGEPDDTDASCGLADDGIALGGGGCLANREYTCGRSAYRIECTCPAATCTCTKNGVAVGTGTFGGCGAGSCSSTFGGVAEQCGIPAAEEGTAPGPPPGEE